MTFWTSKPLQALSDQEWEALCDGCGKCCLQKLQDEDTQEIVYTNVACEAFDLDRCQCQFYDKRFHKVADCLSLREADAATYAMLPLTCAYRRLYEGRDLPLWHYLVSGDRNTVHTIGQSTKGRAIKVNIADIDLEDFIVDWPWEDENY